MSPNQVRATALVLNVGSASVKAARYALPPGAETRYSDLRQTGRISIEANHDFTREEGARAWLSEVEERMPASGVPPDVVVHRVVHGGDRTSPAELTQATLAELEALAMLAPLHQPPTLALIREAIERWPDSRQIGVFDTSWHQTMPEKHRILPIPYSFHARGVKRYGFHGLAFQSALRQLAQVAPECAHGRVILAHLGGGSSLCAVRDGHSVATTMGLTPLGGIPMATRTGSLDPGVLLHLQRHFGMLPDDIDRLLWHESGLKGISGESADMRTLLASGSDGARRAIDVYVTGVAQGIASMAACIRGIDVLAFSGGIGMHAAEIRARVIDELDWLGLKIDPGFNRSGAAEISSPENAGRVFVLPIDEEHEMMNAAMQAL